MGSDVNIQPADQAYSGYRHVYVESQLTRDGSAWRLRVRHQREITIRGTPKIVPGAVIAETDWSSDPDLIITLRYGNRRFAMVPRGKPFLIQELACIARSGLTTISAGTISVNKPGAPADHAGDTISKLMDSKREV